MRRLTSEVAIVGSGFAGSLLARVLATLGYDVVLLERGTHPRFALGESSTPLANLSLERLAVRYGLADCYRLATHGRWLAHFPELRRGLKRGFTFYRHHPDQPFADRGLESERLLVAASPNDALADTQWLRADIDHHFVREAIRAGVEYIDRVELTGAEFATEHVHLTGTRDGAALELEARFVVDATGPGGFLARQLAIPSALAHTETRSAIVYSHFDGVRSLTDAVPSLPAGPYPDEWAAVHHLIDEGWMYSLRFDDGLTSAGFLLTPRGLAAARAAGGTDPESLWRGLVARYPTLAATYTDATPIMPTRFQPAIQHRLTSGAGPRWAMLPHAYAFIDPLFSTGIAWGLRAVERLALSFESVATGARVPDDATLERYDALLGAEADQIDRLVAGAYESMSHFDLFAAQAMLYFGAVSFAEVSQRLSPERSTPWDGVLGLGDPVLGPLPRQALARLREITGGHGATGSSDERRQFADWVARSIELRNVAGLAEPARRNMYPVDLELLVDRHSLLGLTREQLVDALPALRGMHPEPSFGGATALASSGSERVSMNAGT